MKLIVQFDIDGVLVDFIKGFVRYGVRIGALNQPFEHIRDNCDAVSRSYGTAHAVGENANREIWSALHGDPTFWLELPDAVGRLSFRRINDLQKRGHVVYFATNRHGTHVKSQTVEWLRVRGIDYPTVILTAQKGKVASGLGATHAIEDKAGNAVYIAYESPGTESYLINRAYNVFDHSMLGSRVRRIETVEQFLDILEEKS